MILRVVRSIKEVLILLHVLVGIFRLDMIAETISIREQQLRLVTILRLDVIKTQTLCFVYVNLMTLLLQILISTFVPTPEGAIFGDWTMMHVVGGMKTTTG